MSDGLGGSGWVGWAFVQRMLIEITITGSNFTVFWKANEEKKKEDTSKLYNCSYSNKDELSAKLS